MCIRQVIGQFFHLRFPWERKQSAVECIAIACIRKFQWKTSGINIKENWKIFYDEEKSKAIISRVDIEKCSWEQSRSLSNVSQWPVRPSHRDWSTQRPSLFLKKTMKNKNCFIDDHYPPPMTNFSLLTKRNISRFAWFCRVFPLANCPTQGYFFCLGNRVNRNDSPKPKKVLWWRSDHNPAQNPPKIYSFPEMNFFLSFFRVNYLALTCLDDQNRIFKFIDLIQQSL